VTRYVLIWLRRSDWGEALWVMRPSLPASTKSRAHCWDGARCRRAIEVKYCNVSAGPRSLLQVDALSSFLITIDTEGDDIWSRRSVTETRNASFLPRFQLLCEKFGLKPTYLVNHEMANDRGFVEFGRDLIARGAGEIGMHLHAWNSPPINPLTSNDSWCQPFLIEYPEDEIRKKIEFHTHFLEDAFGVKMLSHRSGRWALNAFYADVLREFGFKVDCSVTPHVDWRSTKGDPDGAGGTDYRGFPG
jgi:hypothetical protein